jgi:hypothetical protein
MSVYSRKRWRIEESSRNWTSIHRTPNDEKTTPAPCAGVVIQKDADPSKALRRQKLASTPRLGSSGNMVMPLRVGGVLS